MTGSVTCAQMCSHVQRSLDSPEPFVVTQVSMWSLRNMLRGRELQAEHVQKPGAGQSLALGTRKLCEILRDLELRQWPDKRSCLTMLERGLTQKDPPKMSATDMKDQVSPMSATLAHLKLGVHNKCVEQHR